MVLLVKQQTRSGSDMAVESGVGIGPKAQLRHGFEDRVTKALAGVNQYLPAATSVMLNGKSMTQPEIVKTLQDILQLFNDLRTARATAQAQHKTALAGVVPGHAFYLVLERAMQAFLGNGNPLLAQFGYPVGNRKPVSGATRVKAQAKSRLTRALRHTMGSKQRARIQAVAPETVTVGPDGTVQAVVAAPVDPANGGSETLDPVSAMSASGVAE
jgi:hypothetical protein